MEVIGTKVFEQYIIYRAIVLHNKFPQEEPPSEKSSPLLQLGNCQESNTQPHHQLRSVYLLKFLEQNYHLTFWLHALPILIIYLIAILKGEHVHKFKRVFVCEG